MRGLNLPKAVTIRLTEQDYEQLREYSRLGGHTNLAAACREIILQKLLDPSDRTQRLILLMWEYVHRYVGESLDGQLTPGRLEQLYRSALEEWRNLPFDVRPVLPSLEQDEEK